jgi:hypothetical protein
LEAKIQIVKFFFNRWHGEAKIKTVKAGKKCPPAPAPPPPPGRGYRAGKGDVKNGGKKCENCDRERNIDKGKLDCEKIK